jgi:hypothetical protein
MKNKINKEGRRSMNATLHDQAAQDHRQGAPKDPNKNRAAHKANHRRGKVTCLSFYLQHIRTILKTNCHE